MSTVDTKISGEVCKRDSWGWTGEGEEGFKVDLCLSVQYCVNQASVPWGKMSQVPGTMVVVRDGAQEAR